MSNSNKRVILIIIDSLGIGYLPDAYEYGDEGSNTLKAITSSSYYNTPTLVNLGLFNIENIDYGTPTDFPMGSFCRMAEKSKGKDTIIGHWEICGIISDKPLSTYPNGFPEYLITQYSELTGRDIICNKSYSGTKVLTDYGREHQKTGALIVYTSDDSVFQVAAHEEVIPIDQLYEYCIIARKLMMGNNNVGRIIARPFVGEYPYFKRTDKRKDFSLPPPARTILDDISRSGLDVVGIGKINDIFAGRGITRSIKATNNIDAMNATMEEIKNDYAGLIFTNLIDFDMTYGHRNNVDGYAKAMSTFDKQLSTLINSLKKDDVLIITADHGCDPSTESTNHSREYTPMIIYGNNVKKGINLNTRSSFSDIGSTILDYLGIVSITHGDSFWNDVKIRCISN